MINKKKLTKRQFSFKFMGRRDGISYYSVDYKSKISKKIWSAYIWDKLLIEVTKNRKHPKQIYLRQLRSYIKRNWEHLYTPGSNPPKICDGEPVLGTGEFNDICLFKETDKNNILELKLENNMRENIQ
jgi:hypothetical protein